MQPTLFMHCSDMALHGIGMLGLPSPLVPDDSVGQPAEATQVQPSNEKEKAGVNPPRAMPIARRKARNALWIGLHVAHLQVGDGLDDLQTRPPVDTVSAT